MNRNGFAQKKGETPAVTPPATHSRWQHTPYIVIYNHLLDYSIFKDGEKLRLFLALMRKAPGYARSEVIDNELIQLAPYSGIFKGVYYAKMLGMARTTLWRYMRSFVKAKLLKRTVKHSFSLYSLTDKVVMTFNKTDVKHYLKHPSDLPRDPQRDPNGNLYPILNKGGNAPPSKKMKCPTCKGNGETGSPGNERTCFTCKGKQIIWREDYELLKKEN